MERKRTVWTALALLGLLVVAVIGVSLLISMTLDSGWLGGEKVGVIRIEGVITELANVQGLLEKVGVQSVVIKSGRYKDLASPFRAMSAEDRALLQNVLDDVHDQFIRAVATGRALKVEQVRDLADGRIFTGRQARTAKLVDEVGDLQDSTKLAARLVGIEGEPRVVEPRKRLSLRDLRQSFLRGRGAQLVPSRINLKYLLSL